MNFIETIILISLAASAVGYIIADTKAAESYAKLVCRMFGCGKAFFRDPVASRLGFWMRMGMKWPNSFIVALASCGECLSVFCSIGLSLLFGDTRFVVVFATVWATIVFYYGLSKAVYILNKKG